MVEKVPKGWIDAVKRALLPELTELRHKVKALNIKSDALNEKVDGFRNEVVSRIESLEKRFPLVQG